MKRPELQRRDNDAMATLYGRTLRSFLKTHATDPNLLASIDQLINSLQDAAERTFPAAYRRGMQQAAGKLATFGHQDSLFLELELVKNRQYLEANLKPDIIAKIGAQRLDLPSVTPEQRVSTLDASFGSRLEQLYGGVLWRIAEAGFRAGVLQLNTIVQSHLPTLTQDEEQGDNRRKEEELTALALLLGLTLAQLLDLLSRKVTILVGARYVSVHDARTCDGCDGAEGDYYPPQIPPLPGEVCEGGPLCRCHLETIVKTT